MALVRVGKTEEKMVEGANFKNKKTVEYSTGLIFSAGGTCQCSNFLVQDLAKMHHLQLDAE